MAVIKTTNMDKVILALKASGITNSYAISGILAILSKESGFVPQSEKGYSGTSNSRIRDIFSKTRNLSDSQLSALKANDVNFFNYVYGGKYGNSPTEGYKYRGRGFNQLTFKDNYAKYGKILGLDLVSSPDLVNQVDPAARIVAAYFMSQFRDNANTIAARYGVKDINDFKDTTTAVNAFYNANAGFGKDTSHETTTGKTQALDRVKALYNATMDFFKSPQGKITAGAVLVTAAAALFLASRD